MPDTGDSRLFSHQATQVDPLESLETTGTQLRHLLRLLRDFLSRDEAPHPRRNPLAVLRNESP